MGMLLFAMLLGHLIGDYLLQTPNQAKYKVENNSKGWVACMDHCTVYTGTILFSMLILGGGEVQMLSKWHLSLLFILIYNSHFWIDKFSLGKWYMIKVKKMPPVEEWENMPYFPRTIMPLVYVAVDNTMHLVLMTAIIMWMFN